VDELEFVVGMMMSAGRLLPFCTGCTTPCVVPHPWAQSWASSCAASLCSGTMCAPSACSSADSTSRRQDARLSQSAVCPGNPSASLGPSEQGLHGAWPWSRLDRRAASVQGLSWRQQHSSRLGPPPKDAHSPPAGRLSHMDLESYAKLAEKAAAKASHSPPPPPVPTVRRLDPPPLPPDRPRPTRSEAGAFPRRGRSSGRRAARPRFRSRCRTRRMSWR
jgi:hypothetical protein